MKKITLPFLCLLCLQGMLLETGCHQKRKHSEHPVQQSTLFSAGIDRGKLLTDRTDEASGIAVSRLVPGALWTHNDSGNGNDIFLLSDQGALLAEFKLKGFKNRDWEDIAAAPDPKDGTSYLYVCDCGDNDSKRKEKYIYRFAEPKVENTGSSSKGEIPDVQTLAFEYPDGKRDSEAMMVDPKTGDIYVITKREDNVHVYVAAYPQAFGQTVTLQSVGQLPMSFVVAADISADGSEVLVKTYEKVFYWKRSGNESIAELLKKPPVALMYEEEEQGEAIGWHPDGSGFYTLGESGKGGNAHIYFYKRQNP